MPMLNWHVRCTRSRRSCCINSCSVRHNSAIETLRISFAKCQNAPHQDATSSKRNFIKIGGTDSVTSSQKNRRRLPLDTLGAWIARQLLFLCWKHPFLLPSVKAAGYLVVCVRLSRHASRKHWTGYFSDRKCRGVSERSYSTAQTNFLSGARLD